MQKLLILGGTGAMGIPLVELLTGKKDFEVYITSRKNHQSRDNVYYIKGDAHDLVFLKSILSQRFDVIVDFMSYRTLEFKNVVDCFLSSTNHYFYLSSARCFSNSDSLITEKTPRLIDVCDNNEYIQTDEYALGKCRQENLLRESNKNNWTIIRPYITYSENRFQLGVLEKEEWLYRALHGRTIVFSKDISDKYTTLTDGRDVSTIIIKLMNNPNTLGESYNVMSEESIRWSEILAIYVDELGQFLGKNPKVLMQDKCINLKHSVMKWQVLFDRYYDRKFSNNKVASLLEGNILFSKIDDGLRACLRQFLMKPNFGRIDWRKEAMFDKLTRETTPLSEIPTLKLKIKYLLYRYLK